MRQIHSFCFSHNTAESSNQEEKDGVGMWPMWGDKTSYEALWEEITLENYMQMGEY